LGAVIIGYCKKKIHTNCRSIQGDLGWV